jgi:D-lactate dehydrogenase (cytochrome)
MICEAGVVLQNAQEAALKVDRLFPLSLGAEGTCTIGGNLGSNAGGTGALAYGVARDQLAEPHPWNVLLELSSPETKSLRDTLESALGEAAEKDLLQDAVLAANETQRTAFWRLRLGLSDVQRQEGGSIKHDISVPVADVPAFLDEANAAVLKLIPGARLVPFGHMGDGNIHYNVSQPVGDDRAAFLARWDEVNALVHGIVAKYGGSISAEHGIGVMKRDLLPSVKDPVEMEMMRSLKRMLDPNGILNPGKML